MLNAGAAAVVAVAAVEVERATVAEAAAVVPAVVAAEAEPPEAVTEAAAVVLAAAAMATAAEVVVAAFALVLVVAAGEGEQGERGNAIGVGGVTPGASAGQKMMSK